MKDFGWYPQKTPILSRLFEKSALISCGFVRKIKGFIVNMI